MEGRKIEKITIKVTIDKPDPMPMVMAEQIGAGNQGGKKISVSRNTSGSLVMIDIGDNGYVVDMKALVQGILDYEEYIADPKGERSSDMWPEQSK